MIKLAFRRLIKPYLTIIKTLTDTIGTPTIQGVGRPDIPTTLSAENQAKASNAPIGALFTSTDGAGVGALQWQKTAEGWALNDADTGWLDLQKTSTPNNSPSYQIRRIGNVVHLRLDKWSGNRIELPDGFTAGDSYFQFVAPLLDGTTQNAEVSATGNVHLMGSNQAKPWGNPAVADNYNTKSAWNNSWKIIKPHNSGLKMYITFATPDPFPTALPTPLANYERGNTYTTGVTNNVGKNWWAIPNEFVKTDNSGDFIVIDDLSMGFAFPRPTLATAIEIRGGLLGADINGAAIWYSTDNAATWVNSGITTAGHTDNESKQDVKTYEVPVANITNISLRKTGLKLNSFLISCKEYAR